ncbi:MAG: HAD family hydrolase [Vulcanisaeta sp.]
MKPNSKFLNSGIVDTALVIVLIDLDGTLLPLDAWDPVFQEVSRLIAERANIEWSQVYRAAKELNKALLRRFDIKAFDWDYIFTEVAHNLGVHTNVRVNEVLIKYVRGFKPYDGAIELLKMIKDLGHKIVIATNGLYSYQSIVINELGFSKYIDSIRTPDKVGCPKNCREFFDNAHVMIGDNPLFDVYYPSMFGLVTIFVGDWDKRLNYVRDVWGLDLSGIKPTYSCKNISEVMQVIPKLLNG